MIFVGGILHLVVVALPLVCVGGSVRDAATLAFLVGASGLYFGDAVTMRWTRSESASSDDTRARRWAMATGTLLLLLLWTCLVERAVRAPTGSWLQSFGGALLFAGVILRATAVRTLGKNFRTEIDRVSGTLVKKGVYSWVRHPSETGLLAASLGTALLLQSTLGLVVWCGALLPVTLVRLSLEESALAQLFGADYRRYAEEVAGLLPLARGISPDSTGRRCRPIRGRVQFDTTPITRARFHKTRSLSP